MHLHFLCLLLSFSSSSFFSLMLSLSILMEFSCLMMLALANYKSFSYSRTISSSGLASESSGYSISSDAYCGRKCLYPKCFITGSSPSFKAAASSAGWFLSKCLYRCFLSILTAQNAQSTSNLARFPSSLIYLRWYTPSWIHFKYYVSCIFFFPLINETNWGPLKNMF